MGRDAGKNLKLFKKTIMDINFTGHLKEILNVAEKTFRNKGLTQGVGIVNVKGDESYAMDKRMESVIIEYLRERNLPVHVFSEEIGYVEVHPEATHLVVFDPLDGSTHYKLGQGILPYGLLISVYKGLKPKLSDIIASGMYEVVTESGYLYDGTQTTTLDGNKVDISQPWTINNKTSTYFDLYYKEAVEKFGPLAQKVHLKWVGSNISSLLYVLKGIGAVMGSAKMRPEEIGAVASLIKGAGGVVLGLEGQNLLDEPFDINSVYPFVAGNKEVAEFVVKNI